MTTVQSLLDPDLWTAATGGFNSSGCTNSCLPANDTNPYAGQCKWNSLNTALTCSLVITLLLNVFASVILFRVPLVTVRGRSNPVYLCIRFLNVSDVAQSILLMVMPAFADPDCVWLGGAVSCSIMGFMALFLLLVSPLITILMAFDRVIALYQPFKYRSNLGLKILKVLLPSACGFVFIITTLPIFGVGEYHVVRGRRMCLLDTITDDRVDTVYVLAVHCIFLVALLFMAACTVTFQVKLFRMSFDKKHKSAVKKKRTSGRRTRNATITTMAVCLIFIICYLPYVVRVMYESSSGNRSATLLTWATFALAFLQPLLNPVVYVATNVRYRQELQVLVRNMKASELDSSSDSQHHGNSRGAFSEFRRRISGKSVKHGSQKNKWSKCSHQGSITSPTQGQHNNGNHLKSNQLSICSSKKPSPHPDSLVGSSSQRVLQRIGQRRTISAACREPSTSSGIRSFGSHEHLAVPPSSHKFGRLGRFSEEDSQIDATDASIGFRERSQTLSGSSGAGKSPYGKCTLAASACSTSVPLLIGAPKPKSTSAEIRVFVTSPGRAGRNRGISSAETPRKPGSFPKSDDRPSSDYASAQRRSSNTSCASSDDEDLSFSLPEVFEEKPRHRDSGVGEPNDGGHAHIS